MTDEVKGCDALIDVTREMQEIAECKSVLGILPLMDRLNETHKEAYFKLVLRPELDINLKMSNLGICPQVLGFRPINNQFYSNQFVMASKRYEMTLREYYCLSALKPPLTPERLKLEEELIIDKIGELHHVGYGHGDTNLDNFVLNRPSSSSSSGNGDETIDLLTCNVKIIDFGFSSLLDSPSDKEYRRNSSESDLWKMLGLESDASTVQFDLTYCRWCLDKIRSFVQSKQSLLP